MKRLAISLLAAMPLIVSAAPAPILIEACGLFKQAAKRAECLRAADERTSGGGYASAGGARYNLTQPVASRQSQSTSAVVARPARKHASEDSTCYVGPRGGTYTITASGRKNYNGC